MNPTVASDLRRALALTAGVALAVITCAAVVRAAFAADARALLGWRFPGVPATPAEAWAIWLNNARKLAGILGLALILQSPWLAGERAPDERPGWHRALTWLCDCGAVGSLATTFVGLSVGLGAYGERTVRAVLPHGPVEAFAFACGLVLYHAARRGPVARRRAVTLALAGVALLIPAAVLETYVEV